MWGDRVKRERVRIERRLAEGKTAWPRWTRRPVKPPRPSERTLKDALRWYVRQIGRVHGFAKAALHERILRLHEMLKAENPDLIANELELRTYELRRWGFKRLRIDPDEVWRQASIEPASGPPPDRNPVIALRLGPFETREEAETAATRSEPPDGMTWWLIRSEAGYWLDAR